MEINIPLLTDSDNTMVTKYVNVSKNINNSDQLILKIKDPDRTLTISKLTLKKALSVL